MVHQVKKKRNSLAPEDYVKGILNSDIAVLSQAITLTESTLPEHRELSCEIIDRCMDRTGNSMRIGITGVPGVGKSSFIEVFGLYLTQSLGKKLAVLAIDPTSSVSKGSIMGDKVRMEKLSRDPDTFIRPSPTSGSAGGVARKTRETILLCEAAGFDTIIVETVGVGQSETAVHSMVDFFLLLLLAGAGDSLQGIKRGVMEMADALAITKADGENLKETRRAIKEYRNALKLFPPKESGWEPRVMSCSSLNNVGIEDIWHTIDSYFKEVKSSGYLARNRKQQAKRWMHETILNNLESDFYCNPEVRSIIDELEEAVTEGNTSPFTAAKKLLDKYLNRSEN